MTKRQSDGHSSINTFEKGLNTDIKSHHLNAQSLTYARNAINNSHVGDLFNKINEPANKFCESAPYDIIGNIHLEKNLWCIFSTNDIDSEIGVFDSDTCEYKTTVNNRCLRFKRTHLISGASRRTFDCGFQVYWQDNLNSDRTLRLEDVPWFQDCVDNEGCVECTDTDQLDCNKLLLETHISQPCYTLSRGNYGGSIPNGSYYVQIAYLVNEQRVTDYFPMSNVLSLFTHENQNASIDINLENLDTSFDEYEVALVSQIAEKLSVRRLGTYSTNQTKITIDIIDESLPVIPADNLAITNPIADRSEGMFSVGKYLFRTGITGKFDFNYQPLANQIRSKWQAVEYPSYYYRDGGTNVGHMRDEVYSYFIRWIYKTGDKSASFHIPGRPPRLYDVPGVAGSFMENANYPGPTYPTNPNNIEDSQGLTPKVFEMFNTASATAVNIPLDDGGIVTAEGDMGYHESTEIYPDKSPEVWNTNDPNRPELDLCGKPIRHHKFPENTVYDDNGSSTVSNHYTDDGETIRIMGVAFENIQPPVDNNGNVIPNIEGYEILRGSRDGNKTVLFKGMINNMREYDIPSKISAGRQGLYPNYPFNSLEPDPFNSTTETSYETLTGLTNYNPNPEYSKKHHTFHSPDTMFNKPFIGQKELKVYGALYGNAQAEFIEPELHPKHVFITDFAFLAGIGIGVGLAISKAVGKKTTTITAPSHYTYPVQAGTTNTVSAPANLSGAVFNSASNASLAGVNAINTELNDVITAVTGVDASTLSEQGYNAGVTAANVVPGWGVTTGGFTVTRSDQNNVPTVLRIGMATNMFLTNVGEGADLTMDLIRNFSKDRQFARQYIAYCGYEKFASPNINNKRRVIDTSNYLDSHLQNFKSSHRINNVLRNKTVALETKDDVLDLTGTLQDRTHHNAKMTDLPDPLNDATFERRASSHYVAMKSRLRNQYGQIHSIQQIPTSSCIYSIKDDSTGTIFGGDTYIGRYQEKNTFYHFLQWLQDQPDRAEWNYHLYDAVQHTAFWMDTEPFDTGDFVSSISQAIANIGNGGGFQGFLNSFVTPSDKHCFDRDNGIFGTGLMTLRNVWMYLFHSSIRDFFVETELNIDHRDHNGTNATKHWDALQDLKTLFNMREIRSGNYYKLDRSLSVSRLPYSKINWGVLQPRDYNPTIAEDCYTDFPLRLLYSLPEQTALKRDNWSAFLGNNYKDFSSKVTAIKAIRSTGVMLLFENEDPGLYPGTDELQLKSGTSITVGDGGLFTREMQRMSNADNEYEYGSCQSRRGVINTPVGTFFISQEQGKVFMASEGLKEITLKSNNYWFNQYLPYQLLKDFPDYDILDNPVAGIGCQIMYDNEWLMLYICKKDYRAKREWLDRMIYVGEGEFLVDGITRIKTGDSRYFDNASWTVSYDPKGQEEISWHDWHPDLMMGAPNSFFTVKGPGIWEHNKRCDLYCNYYNKDFPFELEFQLDNMPNVSTVRNIEYFMRVYEFEENCRDRFHALDFNFDEAVIHNTEQVTGLLKLNLREKNDVTQYRDYPIVNNNSIDIIYSKEEHKYRFNQFWDITRDRGEFTIASETIWNTEPNGYIKNLNITNLDYQKREIHRKKIRHHNNKILLRRNVCGNKQMIMYLANTKLQNSQR